jgi:hypothetical protein
MMFETARREPGRAATILSMSCPSLSGAPGGFAPISFVPMWSRMICGESLSACVVVAMPSI